MERKYVNSNVIVKTLMVIVDYISVICGIVSAYNLRLLLPFSESDMALILIIGVPILSRP